MQHIMKPLQTLRNSRNLIFGTGVSQVIIALSLPLVTRIYSVSEVGTSALVVSVFSSLSIIGCLRYEIAIPLPLEQEQGNKLVWLSILISFATTFLITGSVILLSFFGPDLKDLNHIGYSIIPIYFLSVCLLNIANMATIRRENYGRHSRSRLLMAVVQVPAQVILGVMGADASGLLIGYAAGNLVAAAYLLYEWKILTVFSRPRKSELMTIAQIYKGFPLHTSLASLLNTLTLEAPLIYFGIKYSTSRAGYVGMVQTIIAVPLSLVTSSIGLAIYGEWGKGRVESNQERLKLRQDAIWLVKRCAIVAVAYFLTAALFAQFLSVPIFGIDWQGLPKYIFTIGPFYLAVAIVNPTGWILELFGRTQLTLVRSITRIIELILLLIILDFLNSESTQAAVLFSVFGIVGALTYLLISFVPLHLKIEKK
jgi:O-antigen/teichoic acid export membrane protein